MNTLRPEQNGRHFADDISKLLHLENFDWTSFLKIQLVITQHCCRWWLVARSATSHYLNQWWPSSQTNISVTRHQYFHEVFCGTLRISSPGIQMAVTRISCSGQPSMNHQWRRPVGSRFLVLWMEYQRNRGMYAPVSQVMGLTTTHCLQDSTQPCSDHGIR